LFRFPTTIRERGQKLNPWSSLKAPWIARQFQEVTVLSYILQERRWQLLLLAKLSGTEAWLSKLNISVKYESKVRFANDVSKTHPDYKLQRDVLRLCKCMQIIYETLKLCKKCFLSLNFRINLFVKVFIEKDLIRTHFFKFYFTLDFEFLG